MMPYVIVDLHNVVLYNIGMPRAQDADFAANVGNAIVARRDWLFISQADLAERLDVTPTQMSRYERGVDQVSALQLARIATALGSTPNFLLGWSNDTPLGAQDHLAGMNAILADHDISATVQVMLGLSPVDRPVARRLVETYAERVTA
jgi:plasmid maintenance system antidote protein VapI